MALRRFNLTKIGQLGVGPSDGDKLNDIWGYVHSTGIEYAIVGRRNRTEIVDISTDPGSPTIVGTIPGPPSLWRDMKTRGSNAYVVHDSISSGTNQGIQIVDLTDPTAVSVVANYTTNFDRAHNIFIEGKYLYACEVSPPRSGANPLVILDLTNPTAPVEVGVYTNVRFHDVYVRGNLVYGAAEDLPGVVILDVTNKAAPIELGQFTTPEGVGHNTWLSDDGQFLFVTNEVLGGHLRIYDVSNPASAFQVGEYEARPNRVIHNVYVSGNFAYISYYAEGVVILDISDPTAPREVGVYDTSDVPLPDPPTSVFQVFHGVWGLYPFYPSEQIVASDIERGMFLLERTRSPVDIILCLDRSGSMNSPVPGGSDTKINLLKQAVELFMAKWTPFAAPEDRMGVVYFETGITSFPPAGPTDPLLLPYPAEQPAISGDVSGQITGAMTAMGAGLKRAIAGFDSSQESRRVVLLFTDGRQNQDPKVLVDADGTLRLEGTRLSDHNLEIHTIGVGVEGVDWQTLLQRISAQTNALHHFTSAPDTDLEDFFEDNLVELLKGGTVQLVGAERGRIGPNEVREHRFDEPGTARRLTFALSCSASSPQNLPLLTLQAPGNAPLPSAHYEQTGEFFRVVSYRTPIVANGSAVDTQGEWTVCIEGLTDSTASDYRITMLVDDWRFHPRCEVAGGPFRVGDPIFLEAWLEENKVVVEGLERVRVQVLRPSEPLGELLSLPMKTSQPPDGPDPLIDRRDVKLAAIVADPELSERLRPKFQELELRKDFAIHPFGFGTNFMETTIPGSYRFTLELVGKTPKGGRFTRRCLKTVLVNPGSPDPTRSEIAQSISDNQIRWQITPRDRFGGSLGPGLADRFSVVPPLFGIKTTVKDGDDGTYHIVATLPPAVRPDNVNLAFDGHPIVLDTKTPDSGPRLFWSIWRWWIRPLIRIFRKVFPSGNRNFDERKPL